MYSSRRQSGVHRQITGIARDAWYEYGVLMDILTQAMDRLVGLVTMAGQLTDADTCCATLATATPDGRPSARILFIERIEPEGLVFCVHTQSGKAQQMLANPHVGIGYYWPSLQQQVNIEGEAAMLSESDSDHYWRTRSRESQLGAWASNQPERLEDPAQLRHQLDEARKQFSFVRVPRPDSWRAFRVTPTRLEFWHSNWRRMKGRVRYERNQGGDWQVGEYNP